MRANTVVSSTGTHSIDKPARLRGTTISEDLTWHNLETPYVILENTYVSKNSSTASTLTIEEGTEIRFGQNIELQVGLNFSKGNLLAQGSTEEPIVFTGLQQNLWVDFHCDRDRRQRSVNNESSHLFL